MMTTVTCIYFKYNKGNYDGKVGNIHIKREEMDSVCSLFGDLIPKSIKEDNGNLYLQYDNVILIVENYEEFKKTSYFKNFEDKVVKSAGIKRVSIVLNYPKDPNLIRQINMVDYTNLAKLYGKKYGIDPNLIIAVMAHNNLEHTYEVNDRGRIGIMNVPYEKVSRDISYYDYDKKTIKSRCFSLDELTNMGSNIEAWCILFQRYLIDNEFNIMVALELINEDYANTVFNAISEYTREKYLVKGTSSLEPHDNDEVYFQIGVKDLSDFNWLAMLMDDNGKVYSEEVLAYFPDIEFRIKTTKNMDIIYNIQNVYQKDKKNT